MFRSNKPRQRGVRAGDVGALEALRCRRSIGIGGLIRFDAGWLNVLPLRLISKSPYPDELIISIIFYDFNENCLWFV